VLGALLENKEIAGNSKSLYYIRTCPSQKLIRHGNSWIQDAFPSGALVDFDKSESNMSKTNSLKINPSAGTDPTK